MSKDLERILFRGEADPLIMLHKPRGSKGVWQIVENKSKLRVTKGKGKRLKLQYQVHLSEEQDVQVVLLDLEKKSICKKGFNIESAKKINQCIEMDIKLLKVCKPSLQFALYLTTVNGKSWVAKSVEFATHNSGTVSTKPSDPNGQSKTPTVKKEKRPRSSSDSSPSPSSPPLISNSLQFTTAPILVKTPLPGFQPHAQFHAPSHNQPSHSLAPQFPHNHQLPAIFGVPSLIAHEDEKIPSIPLCTCGCMDQIPLSIPDHEKPTPPPNFFAPEKQQRFQCLTCKELENEVICIICAISCHGEHEIKYAGVSSNACVCVQSRSSDGSNQHNVCSSFSSSASNMKPVLADDAPAPKRQKLSSLDELGLVAQVCSQTNPLPVI